MNKRSRRYQKLTHDIEKKHHSLEESCEVIKKISTAKFDESIDMALNLKTSPKTTNPIKGSIFLPHGTGKKIKIAVFAKGSLAKEAKEAGADIVGAESLEKMIIENILQVDKVIASTEMMEKISKLGKYLGPKGLMPNIKSGTITNNIKNAIREIRAGKINFKADKNGIVHVLVGRTSFNKEKLLLNIKKTIETILKTKTISIKGEYIKKISISPSMGPSIKIRHNF